MAWFVNLLTFLIDWLNTQVACNLYKRTILEFEGLEISKVI